MIIEEADFRLIPASETGNKFDLEFLYIVNKGKENERSEFKNAAYGITLETAIDYIANRRVINKNPDTITLKDWLIQYKDVKEELKKLCS